MTSFFDCGQERPKKEEFCFFKNVGICGRHVSDYICNNHAALFGVIYEKANFHTGLNQPFSRTLMYALANGNINIPLFKNRRNEIVSDEVNSFVESALDKMKLDPFDLRDRILCLLSKEILQRNVNCKIGWLGEPNTYLIVTEEGQDMSYYRNLPYFIQALFQYSDPSNITNGDNNASNSIYLMSNIILVYNPMTDTYKFQIPSQILPIFLKYDPFARRSIAHSFVVDAIREVTVGGGDLTIKSSNNVNAFATNDCY